LRTEGNARRGPGVDIHTAPASGFYPPPETCRLQRCTTHAHVYCFEIPCIVWPCRCLRHGIVRTVSCLVFCVLSKSSRYHGCRPRATALSSVRSSLTLFIPFRWAKTALKRESVSFNRKSSKDRCGFISAGVTQSSCYLGFMYSIAASSPCMRDPCAELLVFHVTHGTRTT
jgi:hypothetical protein